MRKVIVLNTNVDSETRDKIEFFINGVYEYEPEIPMVVDVEKSIKKIASNIKIETKVQGTGFVVSQDKEVVNAVIKAIGPDALNSLTQREFKKAMNIQMPSGKYAETLIIITTFLSEDKIRKFWNPDLVVREKELKEIKNEESAVAFLEEKFKENDDDIRIVEEY